MSAIIEVQNLDLSFPLDIFHSSSARDVFIQALTSPLTFFKKTATKHILKNIQFKIHRGEKVALVGINGSGKTTLCRCIAGTLKPDRGTILTTTKSQSIIQTDAGFFPDLTGRENALLLSHFLYADLPEKERLDLVDEAINFSEIGKYADATLDTYSLGMKSRLNLALMTARPQEILILDEIYNHSDEFFRSRIEKRLHNQIQKSGVVIMVSHYDQDLIQLCNRGLVLHEGEIKYDGSVETALKAYRFLNRSN